MHFIALNISITNKFLNESKNLISEKNIKKSKKIIKLHYINYMCNYTTFLYDNFFQSNLKGILFFKKYKEPIFFKLKNINVFLTKNFLNLTNPFFKKIFFKLKYTSSGIVQILKKNYNFDPVTVKIEKKKPLSKNLFFKKNDVFSLMDSQIINFLMFLFKKNVFFTLRKLNPSSKQIEFDSEARYIIWKMMSKYHKKINYNFMRTFYKVLFFSFKLKDPNFFLDWYINILESEGSKRHKFLIHIFYILLKKFHKYIFFSSNIKGMFFYISGKIGVSGNSKKRNIFFNFGKHSGTKKNLRINSTKSIVKTLTGALGVTFNIYF